jgi:hypothetical protein
VLFALRGSTCGRDFMIVAGAILAILGFVFGVYILWILGLILLLVGLVLWFVPVGGATRRWY